MTSVVGSIIRGAVASTVGTLAMDVSLYRRYRHDGGNAPFPGWEPSEGLVSWEKAPAPALVAKQLLESLLKHEVSPRYARFLSNATHWGTASPQASDTGSSSAPGASPRCGSAYRSVPRSGRPDTPCFQYSGSTSRSGSTTSRRSRRTSALTSSSEPPPRPRSLTPTTNRDRKECHEHLADCIHQTTVPDDRRREDPVCRQRRLAAADGRAHQSLAGEPATRSRRSGPPSRSTPACSPSTCRGLAHLNAARTSCLRERWAGSWPR